MGGAVIIPAVLAVLGWGLAAMLWRAHRAQARDLADTITAADAMFDSLNDAVVRIDPAGRLVWLNPAWEMLTGHGWEESLGRSAVDWLIGEDIAPAIAQFGRLAGGEADRVVMRRRLIRRDGAVRDVDVALCALRDADGVLLGAIATITDVTEQILTLQILQQSEARFRTLCDSAPVGIIRFDPSGRVTYLNQRGELILMAPASQCLAREIDGVFGAANAGLWTELTAALVTPGSVYETALEIEDHAGMRRWLALAATAEFDASSRPLGLIATLADVTEAKRLEAALIEARARAEAETAARTRFLADLSHEIRTPMNGVVGLADVLLTRRLDQTSRRYVETIAQSGQTMMALLGDILDMARIDAGRVEIASAPFDLHDCLADTLTLMTASAAGKGLALGLEVAPGLPRRIAGDSLRLRQILANLLGNAVKFTDHGHVALSARAHDGWLEIAVRDTGIGIPPQQQASVFVEFVQADGARAGGAGLGLAISRRLAEAMGGVLTLASEPGVGTCLTLRLPLVAADDAAPERDQSSPEPEHPPGNGLHLLIAEDNRTNQMILAAMLEQLGHRVAVVDCGSQVVARANAARAAGDPFDAVLMDVQMPGLDGLAATRALREAGHDAGVLPVIAVTAHGYAEDISRCLAAGMQAHLVKPLRRADLVRTLDALRLDRAA